MKYLYNSIKILEKSMRDKFVMLFLDYDGTLVPMAQTPQKATLSKTMKDTLTDLSKLKKIRIVIISGRSLKEIHKMVGINNIIYAGNHGLEIGGDKMKFDHPISAVSQKAIEKICFSLRSDLSSIKGILIEDKIKTISVHYRLAEKRDVGKAKKIFYKIIAPYVKRKLVKVTEGKKVFEVRPPIYWNKGESVKWLIKEFAKTVKSKKILPIYIGDDQTDEDAFEAIRDKGITIFVGKPKRSYAKYYLKNTEEVAKLLKSTVSWEDVVYL